MAYGVGERGVEEDESVDERRLAGRDGDGDRAAHGVADQQRGADLLQEPAHQADVAVEPGRVPQRACVAEPDEVERLNLGVERVREPLTDRCPRQRVRAEPVNQEHPPRRCTVGPVLRTPTDRVDL